MTPERWKQVSVLFEGASAQPSAERSAWLARACDGDHDLQAAVERLIAADEKAPGFLEEPPTTAVREALADGLPTPAARIGPYRVIREIGSGGMGVVYLAERDDQTFQKRVAIKLGLHGPRSPDAGRRFREERQILAGLEHPNIARLLDGGTTDGGMPFLVMEYVDGVRIDQYCDERRLPVANRLRLFRDVCAAVQFAHQRLVVHRDIKPGNVLVSADGTPKLLDFGIAKLLDPAPGSPGVTATLERVFTPEYASPEQVKGLPVTTTTDVYQLGILLYGLLTGRRPYGADRSQPHHLAAAICDHEPKRPSTAVSRDATGGSRETGHPVASSADAIGQARGVTAERLRRQLHGDLDAIVLKALRKEPERRYASVEQLSEDIGRHLAGRPVGIRADSAGYRARRFLWRHRVGVAALTVVFLALLGGLGLATWQAQVARRERDRAELEESRSRQLLYAAEMNLAGQSWLSAHVSRANELLDNHTPTPGRADLRGFEWYYLWRNTHSELRTFHGGTFPIAVSPDGRVLATSGESTPPPIHLWELDTGRHMGTLLGHGSQLTSLDFSPDGAWLVSASTDKTSRVWQIGTRQQVAVLSGHRDEVLAARFLTAGNRIATSSADATVKVFDLTGREVATLEGHAGPVRVVAPSPDGVLLASGSEDGTVKLWDLASFTLTTTLSDRRPGPITSVWFSPDRRHLATTGEAWGGIAVWDLRTRTLLPSLNHNTSQFCSAFSPDGSVLATGGHDRVLLLWSVEHQRLINSIRGHGDAVDDLRFLPDGKRLVTTSRDGSTKLWAADLRQGPAVILDLRRQQPDDGFSPPVALAFSPGGDRLAAAVGTGVRIVDVATRREITSVELGSRLVALAWASDGHTLAALDVGADVHVRDLRDPASTVRLRGGKPIIAMLQAAAIAFSPDAQWLAAIAGDGRVRVWKVHDWRESVLEGDTEIVRAVAFSPDSRRLAAAGESRAARIWDLGQQRPPRLLSGHTRPMLWVGFTRDGTRAITSSLDGTVRFWDASTGREVAKVTRGGDLSAAALTPDGRRLIVAGFGDPSLSIVDTATNHLLLTVRGHNAPVSDVEVSPDGLLVASSSNDGTVRLWRSATAQDVASWEARPMVMAPGSR